MLQYADVLNDGQADTVMLPMPPGDAHELRIRAMKLDDIPRVLEIDRQSFSLPWSEKSYHFELTKNPSTLALVAEIDLEDSVPMVIGMSIVWIIVDEAHIATIAIHPVFHGNSYGKNLLAETLRQAIQRGAHQATLEVRESNLVAQKMYRSFGFIMVGQRSHYYHDNNEDAVVMTVESLGQKYLAWMDQL